MGSILDANSREVIVLIECGVCKIIFVLNVILIGEESSYYR